MPETVDWVSDQDGAYVITVDGITVATGTCTGGVPVETLIPFTDFVPGNNPIVVIVTNANGSGSDSVTITRGPTILPTSGLCWLPPLTEGPREDFSFGADATANRLSRFMRAPLQASNVFILKSGAVVTDWFDPFDPIRVSLFGACKGQHVTQADADLLTAAGYGANLVACPSPAIAGFGLDAFGTSSFGGV